MGLFGKNKEKASSSKSSAGRSGGHHGQSAGPSTGATGEQYRSVFLLTYKSATFKSHWALFVPHAQDRSCKTGRKIHAIGNVQEGFEIEIIRNYDLTLTRTKPLTPIELGIVSTQYLVEVAEDFQYGIDTTARDAFEDLILSVPAPSKSLNKVQDNPGGRAGPPRRVTLSDCQWWLTRVVEKLVEYGYLIPPTRGLNKGKNPVEILANAPRH
ncbi:hypothetical protein F5Y05DRAFT_412448 [Hypoxylon sp. FL0543]|nr:hypothetical protein F5Y05DRAFT_412448 [Hypoxylon sp. FL0543]